MGTRWLLQSGNEMRMVSTLSSGLETNVIVGMV